MISRGMVSIPGVTVQLSGRSKVDSSSPTIVMLTHSSTLDAVASIGYSDLPVNFIAKKSLFKIPFFSSCLKAHGTVPIDRTNLKNAIDSLSVAAEMVKKDQKSIIVSPEGTRRRSKSIGDGSELLPFKKGPFHLAKNSGCSITPLVYTGASRLSLASGAVYK